MGVAGNLAREDRQINNAKPGKTTDPAFGVDHSAVAGAGCMERSGKSSDSAARTSLFPSLSPSPSAAVSRRKLCTAA